MEKKFQSPVLNHSQVRIKVSEDLMKSIISADSFLERDEPSDKEKRTYEHNCNRRELKLYNLLRQVVGDFNTSLSSTRIKLRIIEEGDGFYLEMDI